MRGPAAGVRPPRAACKRAVLSGYVCDQATSSSVELKGGGRRVSMLPESGPGLPRLRCRPLQHSPAHHRALRLEVVEADQLLHVVNAASHAAIILTLTNTPNHQATLALCLRVVETDHGAFVLINTYVPNAGGARAGRPRADFKLRFLQARRCPAPCLPRNIIESHSLASRAANPGPIVACCPTCFNRNPSRVCLTYHYACAGAQALRARCEELLAAGRQVGAPATQPGSSARARCPTAAAPSGAALPCTPAVGRALHAAARRRLAVRQAAVLALSVSVQTKVVMLADRPATERGTCTSATVPDP